MNYTDSLALQAAATIRQWADNRGAIRRMAGAPPAPPHTTFPNDLGNYKGKRAPKALGAPLAPRERFRRLVAAYLAFASRPRRAVLA